MKIKFTLLLFLSVCINAVVFAATADTAAFKTANLFQSNMVMQQNKPFTIWGKASPGDKITIKGDWTGKQTTIEADTAGHWRGAIKVPKAKPGDFTPHTLVITDGAKTITLNNLLIGEVWIASGQSNMQYSLKGEEGKNNGVIDWQHEVPKANFPNIRLFYTDLNFKAQPFDEVKGKWQICTPETAGRFSAVAYYFASEIHKNTKLPVGVVLSTIGASTAQAWTNRKIMEADTVLYNKYLREYDNSPKSKEVIDGGFTFEKVTRPTLLYNAMIHPLAGLSIKGFIWYQGEFNRNDKNKYTRLLTAMIKGWRSDFGQGDLPFYLVQVPSFYWNNEDPKAFDYAIFREAQANVRKLKNTEMVVTTDDPDAPRNLHPRRKKPIGLRLARIALNKDYGFGNVQYLGPQLNKIRVDGNQIIVSYKSKTLDGGLATADKKAPAEFFIAGEDAVFYPATAVIKGDEVVLSSAKVTKPVAARYAFTNTAVTNFMNKAGLPAEPFRTDGWADDGSGAKIKVDYKRLNEEL
ncbi:sialate O-acetylesterase [Mucilaginibacter limnophilus]|uniref:Sialate O-acetylesterase n=1 Tax=Mucilaginibacter limnophilus TaxID=1932778 RepID=A0A3S2V063_9SPHI|nr:sialate O-acetylesterase [Mucilaginibacter limnophilus]RVT98349.1 sialate O-acetylesterase [Mucilaginibacter limnophilus]